MIPGKAPLAILALAATLVAACGAHAEESGAYLGAALGQSKLKEWCDTGGSAGITLTSCEDTETAWKLFAGYRFNRYLAVEGSYIDWGETTATASNGISVSASQRSYGLAAVGSAPLLVKCTAPSELRLTNCVV